MEKKIVNFGLLGEKLSHSFSPLIHKFIFENLGIDLNYNLFEVTQDEIMNFKDEMKKYNILGVNITIPYKKSFIENLDYISENAKKIAAINLLYLRENKFYGDNTDYFGFKETLLKNNIEVGDKNFYIIGRGGASLAVKAVLTDLGAKNTCSLYRENKNSYIIFPKNISKDIEKNIIINTTPVGMYPNIHDNIIPENFLKNFTLAIDLIYNPLETVFLNKAKAFGLKTINGLTMLIEQAIKTDEILLDIKINEKIRKNLYIFIENFIKNGDNL